MSLGEIKFIVGVIIWLTIIKGAKSYGFIARVHLVWVSGDFKVPARFFLPVPVMVCQDNASRILGHPDLPLVLMEMSWSSLESFS